jgi:hypothetical protein
MHLCAQNTQLNHNTLEYKFLHVYFYMDDLHWLAFHHISDSQVHKM